MNRMGALSYGTSAYGTSAYGICFSLRDFSLRDLLQHLPSRVAAAAYAIWDADAAVAVARQRDLRWLPAQALDTIQAFEMADAILRHRRLPFINAGKERRGAQAED